MEDAIFEKQVLEDNFFKRNSSLKFKIAFNLVDS